MLRPIPKSLKIAHRNQTPAGLGPIVLKIEKSSGCIHQVGLIQKQLASGKDKIPINKEILRKNSKEIDQRNQTSSDWREEDFKRDAGELQQPKRRKSKIEGHDQGNEEVTLRCVSAIQSP